MEKEKEIMMVKRLMGSESGLLLFGVYVSVAVVAFINNKSAYYKISNSIYVWLQGEKR